MSNKKIFLQALAEVLTREYGVESFLAENMVNSSALNDLYDDMPEFIEHYSMEHWAKQVISENSMVNA